MEENDELEFDNSSEGPVNLDRRAGKRKVIQMNPETDEVLKIFPSITAAATALQSDSDKIMSMLVSISR